MNTLFIIKLKVSYLVNSHIGLLHPDPHPNILTIEPSIMDIICCLRNPISFKHMALDTYYWSYTEPRTTKL
jgi:hypothetical protein